MSRATADTSNGHGQLLAGTVVHGRGLGRQLGFPTANLELHPGSGLPSLGIYAGAVHGLSGSPDQSIPAAISIGKRPTFEVDGKVLVEVHLIDWSGDLYGRELQVTLLDCLREELAFDSVERLVEQMHRDVSTAREVHRADNAQREIVGEE